MHLPVSGVPFETCFLTKYAFLPDIYANRITLSKNELPSSMFSNEPNKCSSDLSCSDNHRTVAYWLSYSPARRSTIHTPEAHVVLNLTKLIAHTPCDVQTKVACVDFPWKRTILGCGHRECDLSQHISPRPPKQKSATHAKWQYIISNDRPAIPQFWEKERRPERKKNAP